MMPELIGVTPLSNPAFPDATTGTISGAFPTVKHSDSPQPEKVRGVSQVSDFDQKSRDVERGDCKIFHFTPRCLPNNRYDR
ncbi:hypothetical protein [Planctellipticum variicoloris]|jgi:hypothetical protein|uniref:hypothetical protein n=1 Tax=Planctellipticum variicoloris TaxID=3064265 RepID=UPI00301349B3